VQDQYQRPVWLYHPNTEHWKNWAQERWMCDPFLGGQRTRGSLTLFDPEDNDNRVHTTFAKSMVSERIEHVPIPNGGYKTIWNVIDRGNNHYLDAIGYACAAAACLGVRIIAPEPQKTIATPNPVRVAEPQRNDRFRRRHGGWIKGLKRK
jgi:hypothetical protein